MWHYMLSLPSHYVLWSVLCRPERPWLSQMYECICVYMSTDSHQQGLHLFPAKHTGTDIACLWTASSSYKPRLLEAWQLTPSWLFRNTKIASWFIQEEYSLMLLYKKLGTKHDRKVSVQIQKIYRITCPPFPQPGIMWRCIQFKKDPFNLLFCVLQYVEMKEAGNWVAGSSVWRVISEVQTKHV